MVMALSSDGNIFSQGFQKSKWIPDNMEDMNNVNMELASVYSSEFKIGEVKKYSLADNSPWNQL